jgi:hypothetical protein
MDNFSKGELSILYTLSRTFYNYFSSGDLQTYALRLDRTYRETYPH